MIIVEGGNVQIESTDGIFNADKIDIKKVDRKLIVKDLNELFDLLNKEFKKEYKDMIWKKDMKNYFSGSTRILMDLSYTDHEIIEYKGLIGDIDVMVDKDLINQVTSFIASLSKKDIGKFKLLGMKEFKSFNKSLIMLFLYKNLNIQVDFEFTEFESGKPTVYALFSRYHHDFDFKNGIKSVFHKFMVRSLTSLDTTKGYLLSPKAYDLLKSCSFNIEKFMKKKKSLKFAESDIKIYSFSVQDGMRIKYEKVKNLKYGGMYVYHEIPTKDSKYVKDVEKIFKMFFTSGNVEKFYSFTGIIELIKSYPEFKVKKIIDRFIELLYGKSGIKLYRKDKNLDMKEKETTIKFIKKELDEKFVKDVTKLEKEFYRKY